MTYQMSRLTLAVRQKMNPSASGPGPQKYSTLHLGMKPSLHRLAEGEKACVVLPQETAPNKVILRKVVGFNTQLDFKLNKQYTIFVRDSVQTTEGSAIAHLISDCSDSEIQCWMRFMTAKYPVAAASLPSHRFGEIQSRSRVMIMMAAAGPGPWQPARRRGATQSYIAVQDNADPGLRHCLLEYASAQPERLPVQCSVCQKGRIFFLRSMALSSSSLSPF